MGGFRSISKFLVSFIPAPAVLVLQPKVGCGALQKRRMGGSEGGESRRGGEGGWGAGEEGGGEVWEQEGVQGKLGSRRRNRQEGVQGKGAGEVGEQERVKGKLGNRRVCKGIQESTERGVKETGEQEGAQGKLGSWKGCSEKLRSRRGCRGSWGAGRGAEEIGKQDRVQWEVEGQKGVQ